MRFSATTPRAGIISIRLYGNRNVSFLLRESVDKLHHLSVVVADYVCSFGSHHLFRITLALVDGCQDSGLGWFGVADAAALEYSFDELFDLCLQHLISNGLIQEREELLVRALKASQELVSDQFSCNLAGWDVWRFVSPGHRVPT